MHVAATPKALAFTSSLSLRHRPNTFVNITRRPTRRDVHVFHAQTAHIFVGDCEPNDPPTLPPTRRAHTLTHFPDGLWRDELTMMSPITHDCPPHSRVQ